MAARIIRNNRGLPRKGSRDREVLRRMLQPAGATARELWEEGLIATPTELGAICTRLSDFKGWDIRRFPAPITRRPLLPRGKKTPSIYRVVGRHYGHNYRSLVAPEVITNA
jgi:hypothetical protein